VGKDVHYISAANVELMDNGVCNIVCMLHAEYEIFGGVKRIFNSEKLLSMIGA
jgi:hypothetical protein